MLARRIIPCLDVKDGRGLPIPVELLDRYGFTLAQLTVDETTGLSHARNLYVQPVDGKPYVVDGIEQAPRALIDLLQGRNIGKYLVRVGSDPQ